MRETILELARAICAPTEAEEPLLEALASAAEGAGTYSRFTPASRAARAMGSMPATGRRVPDRDRSPTNALSGPSRRRGPPAARLPHPPGRPPPPGSPPPPPAARPGAGG